MITTLIILTILGAAAAIYGVIDTYRGGLRYDPEPGNEGLLIFSTRSKKGLVIGLLGAVIGLASGLLGIYLA